MVDIPSGNDSLFALEHGHLVDLDMKNHHDFPFLCIMYMYIYIYINLCHTVHITKLHALWANLAVASPGGTRHIQMCQHRLRRRKGRTTATELSQESRERSKYLIIDDYWTVNDN